MGTEASGTITEIKDISELPVIEGMEETSPKTDDVPIGEMVTTKYIPFEEKPKKEFISPIDIDPQLYHFSKQVVSVLAGKDGNKLNFVRVDKDGYLYCRCEQNIKEVIREIKTEVKEIQVKDDKADTSININLKSEIKIDLWQSLKDIFQNIKAFFRRCFYRKG